MTNDSWKKKDARLHALAAALTAVNVTMAIQGLPDLLPWDVAAGILQEMMKLCPRRFRLADKIAVKR